MTPAEHDEIAQKIEDAYQATVANAEVQRAEQLAALATVWDLAGEENNEKRQAVKYLRKIKAPPSGNNTNGQSQRQMLRRLIDSHWEAVLDTPMIRKRYG